MPLDKYKNSMFKTIYIDYPLQLDRQNNKDIKTHGILILAVIQLSGDKRGATV